MIRQPLKKQLLAILIPTLSTCLAALIIHLSNRFSKDISIVNDHQTIPDSFEFTLRCEKDKFTEFGFIVDFGIKILDCKAESTKPPETLTKSCIKLNDTTLSYEHNKKDTFVCGEEITFSLLFNDSLIIPHEGLDMSLWGNAINNTKLALSAKNKLSRIFNNVLFTNIILIFIALAPMYIIAIKYFNKDQKGTVNLIKDFIENEEKEGIIDFLMLNVISEKYSYSKINSEIYLDSLIDKKEFIKKNISNLPKKAFFRLFFPHTGNSELYIKIRNSAIRLVLKYKLETMYYPTTINEIRNMMTDIFNKNIKY